MPAHPKIKDASLLKKAYLDQEMSTIDISENSRSIFGFFVTPATVYNCLLRYGIPVRSKSVSVTMAKSKTVKLSKIAKTSSDKFNARWLASVGTIKMLRGSLLEKEEADKLETLLRRANGRSLVPESMVQEIFNQTRINGFPFYRFDDNRKLSEWELLSSFKTSSSPFPWEGHGSSLASSFHPHFFECKKRGKMSPLEFFASDDDLKRGITKMLCLYGKSSEAKIRGICRSENAVDHINNFPPRVAITVVNSLYPERASISVLDPCAGFSGRMMGCAASGRVASYHGIDLSPKTAVGLIETIKFIRGIGNETRLSVSNADCIKEMESMGDEFDLVFTSPPFLDTEEYVGVPFETDYGRWLSEFVKPFVGCCWQRLKTGGKMAIYSENIDGSKMFPKDLADFAEQVGFQKCPPILFRKSMGVYQRSMGKQKITPIHVWQKAI